MIYRAEDARDEARPGLKFAGSTHQNFCPTYNSSDNTTNTECISKSTQFTSEQLVLQYGSVQEKHYTLTYKAGDKLRKHWHVRSQCYKKFERLVDDQVFCVIRVTV